MSSLRDLIYSQTSVCDDVGDDANRVDNNDDRRGGGGCATRTSYEYDPLEHFYDRPPTPPPPSPAAAGQPLSSLSPQRSSQQQSPQPPPQSSTRPAHQQHPQPHQRKKRKSKLDSLTPAQRAQHVREKIQRNARRKRIRNRRYDVSAEVDYGGAVEAMARRALLGGSSVDSRGDEGGVKEEGADDGARRGDDGGGEHDDDEAVPHSVGSLLDSLVAAPEGGNARIKREGDEGGKDDDDDDDHRPTYLREGYLGPPPGTDLPFSYTSATSTTTKAKVATAAGASSTTMTTDDVGGDGEGGGTKKRHRTYRGRIKNDLVHPDDLPISHSNPQLRRLYKQQRSHRRRSRRLRRRDGIGESGTNCYLPFGGSAYRPGPSGTATATDGYGGGGNNGNVNAAFPHGRNVARLTARLITGGYGKVIDGKARRTMWDALKLDHRRPVRTNRGEIFSTFVRQVDADRKLWDELKNSRRISGKKKRSADEEEKAEDNDADDGTSDADEVTGPAGDDDDHDDDLADVRRKLGGDDGKLPSWATEVGHSLDPIAMEVRHKSRRARLRRRYGLLTTTPAAQTTGGIDGRAGDATEEGCGEKLEDEERKESNRVGADVVETDGRRNNVSFVERSADDGEAGDNNRGRGEERRVIDDATADERGSGGINSPVVKDEGTDDGPGASSISSSTLPSPSSLTPANPLSISATAIDARYAGASHRSKPDLGTVALTMSAFLSEMGLASRDGDESDGDIGGLDNVAKGGSWYDEGADEYDRESHRRRRRRRRLRELHGRATSYLDAAVSSIAPKTTFSHLNYPGPSAPLSVAVRMQQSYLANSGGCGLGDGDIDSDDDHRGAGTTGIVEIGPGGKPYEGELDDSNNVDADSSLLATASKLVETGRALLHDHRLAACPAAHATTAVATVAAALPPGAAAVLARPCCANDPKRRTPFDLVRSALERWGREAEYVSSHMEWNSPDNTGQVVDALREASDAFRLCIDAEPENIEYWSWHVACLMGAMCAVWDICKSGSGVQQPAFVMTNAGGGGETRRMEAYGGVRWSAAQAVREFISIPSKHGPPGYHMAVSSLLEWSQAVFLLRQHRERSATEPTSEGWKEIRRLHAFHTMHWAKEDCNSMSFRRVEHLAEVGEISIDVLLAVHACLIEENPSDRTLWLKLVSRLGPIGKAGEKRDACTKSGCDECLRLCHGFGINHEELKKRKEKLGWWGDGRSCWWDRHFFSSSPMTTKNLKADFVEKVRDKVSTLMSKDISDGACVDCDHDMLNGVSLCDQPHFSLSWLPESEKDACHFDEGGDSLAGIPAHISEVLSVESTDLEVNQKALVPDVCDTKRGAMCEAICFKVIVACHLFNVLHPFVRESIWYFAWRAMLGGKESDEFFCLVWLSSKGLNVPKILCDQFQKTIEQNNTPCRRSNEDERMSKQAFKYANLM